MSLEHALLDRLEKRSLQIAQQKNEIYGLRQLVNEKIAINEQLAEQITTARLEREQMQHQISELRTECDRIREISKSLVPKSALMQAVQEAAELRSEVARLRAEVPLESTREALKNAVAKLQEVTAQLDSAKGEAEEWLKQCHAARRQRDDVKEAARAETQRLSDVCSELQSKYESLLAKTTDLGSYAMTLGRKEGEPLEMFMERQALRLAALESKAGPSIETLSVELSRRYAEIAGLREWATGVIESGGFADNYPERTMHYRHIVARINSRPQLDLTATLPTVDWQVVARNLEQTIAGLNAKVAELEAQAGKIGYVAKREHEEAVTAARENGIHKGESLSGFIWRQCEGLRKSQAENAPLTKLFVVLCKQRGNLNEEIIYRAVDEASDAIKKLTA